MSLYVIATPIGDPQDIGLRAKQLLTTANVIIGEEAKPTRRLLKSLGIPIGNILTLNEHSQDEDLKELVTQCHQQQVALISDCGTPGFCDPGADLVQLCREQGIAVRSVPGPSSLSCFLSILGKRVDQFWFRGFLSAKSSVRMQELKQLRDSKIPIVLMDTPYRLKKLLHEIEATYPSWQISLGTNLSTDEEQLLSGRPSQVLARLKSDKAEFMLMLFPPQARL